MAIRYGKGLIGGAVVVALLALLVHWIGINTIELYRDDLLFYLQAHLILVLASMLAALRLLQPLERPVARAVAESAAAGLTAILANVLIARALEPLAIPQD